MTAYRGDLKVLSVADVLGFENPAWRIDGVLPKGGLTVIYGAPGAYKSFVTLDMGFSIATGLPWQGREVIQAPVVYLAAEGRSGLKPRCSAWLMRANPSGVEHMFFIDEAVDLLDPAAAGRLAAVLGEITPRPVLVVDTLARSMTGDENSSRDMGAFIAAVDRLRGSNDAIVLHHTRRDAKEERGSGALRGAADVMVNVTAHRHGDGKVVQLSCDKAKDFEPWRSMQLRVEHLGDSLVLEREPRASGTLQQEVLAAFEAADAPLSGTGVYNLVGHRKQTVLEAVKSLHRDGLIVKVGDGYVAVPTAREPSGTGPARGCLSSVPGAGSPVGGPSGGTQGDAGSGTRHATAGEEGAPQDDLLARFASEFDAHEVRGWEERPCSHQNHDRHWCLSRGGPVMCLDCHPPVASDVIQVVLVDG